MSKIVALMATLVVMGVAVLGFPARSYAFDAFENTCDSTTTDASVCQDQAAAADSPSTDPTTGIIPTIANIVAAVSGIIAVVFIMINGLNFMTSSGDSAKLSKARDGLIYAAVGLMIIVSARIIVAVILRYI